jgi:cysteinyl-tRNA synthetase
MIRSRLGETIDIHGGGGDLVFPHHENEIAQSEGAINKPLARYWTHNGMVMVDGQKMSKSLGNFITIRELLDGKWEKHPEAVHPMAVRLFVLQAHYRKPLDFTEDAIASSVNSWKTLQEGLVFGEQFGQKLGFTEDGNQLDKTLIERFESFGDDDFNFSGSLAVLFELAKELRREGNILVHEGKTKTDTAELQQAWYTLVTLAQVLGLEAKLEAVEDNSSLGFSDADIETLIEQRNAARKSKDFAESDRIRNQLQAQGITLIDSKEGTRWHR